MLINLLIEIIMLFMFVSIGVLYRLTAHSRVNIYERITSVLACTATIIFGISTDIEGNEHLIITLLALFLFGIALVFKNPLEKYAHAGVIVNPQNRTEYIFIPRLAFRSFMAILIIGYQYSLYPTILLIISYCKEPDITKLILTLIPFLWVCIYFGIRVKLLDKNRIIPESIIQNEIDVDTGLMLGMMLYLSVTLYV